MKTMELLSPAGDLDGLKAAVAFGADAVYAAGEAYGMRASPKNFSLEELAQGIAYVHARGRRFYLTCNILPRNGELENLPAFIRETAALGVDAFIVADLGVLSLVKRYAPDTDVHISTQMGIVNYAAANACYELGAKRIVTARELSLEEIRTIREKANPKLEIEAFVHGAMCMSFSGRCLISDYLTGRDPNRGSCAQPCRWRYHVTEETRPQAAYPIEEDAGGTYLFNAKDLCMIGHIPQLAVAGIDSLKIEGRAKTEYYTAVTTHAYRSALDGYCQSGCSPDYEPESWVLEEVEKISHRVYSTGFYFGHIRDGQTQDFGGYIRDWELAGRYVDWRDGWMYLRQRNRFFEGEVLEALVPGRPPVSLRVVDLRDQAGTPVRAASQADREFSFRAEAPLPEGAFLRRKRT